MQDKRTRETVRWRTTMDQIFFYTIEASHILVVILGTVSSYLMYKEHKVSVCVISMIISGTVVVAVTLGKLQKYIGVPRENEQ